MTFSRRCRRCVQKKALFAYAAGVREKRRALGQDEVQLMFVAHFNAKCEEEEWVDPPGEEVFVRDERNSIPTGGRLRKKGGQWRVRLKQSGSDDFPPSQILRACRCAW